MARRHGWGNPISADGILDLALEDSEQADGEEFVEQLASEPYITYQRGQGYWIKNDPDSQAQVAFLLTRNCSYTELQIEATLSRFKAAGGFDAYDESVLEEVDDW
ncbi:hypothetical protein SAMN05216277_12219 [Halolamina pelagica]|uniref:Uncharacterized protein n=2 Tax=Haloferacaceae TaxID=1644056 RepID=A0A1I5W1E6_9EURY|nr:hypothetical protein SAMN05216277_12219 [Halolamina pelagica]